MADKYVGVWTVRNVFDVFEDIYMLQGNRFEIKKNATGSAYSIAPVTGLDPDWASADLQPATATKPPKFSGLPLLNSTDQVQLLYADAFRQFLGSATGYDHLEGKVILRGSTASVAIYVDDSTFADAKIIVIHVSAADQSGTGHGDNR